MCNGSAKCAASLKNVIRRKRSRHRHRSRRTCARGRRPAIAQPSIGPMPLLRTACPNRSRLNGTPGGRRMLYGCRFSIALAASSAVSSLRAEVTPKDPFVVRAPLDGVIDKLFAQPNQCAALPRHGRRSRQSCRARCAIAGKRVWWSAACAVAAGHASARAARGHLSRTDRRVPRERGVAARDRRHRDDRRVASKFCVASVEVACGRICARGWRLTMRSPSVATIVMPKTIACSAVTSPKTYNAPVCDARPRQRRPTPRCTYRARVCRPRLTCASGSPHRQPTCR